MEPNKKNIKQRIIRLTEEDFNRVLKESVDRIIDESISPDIEKAQRQLHSVGNTLSSLGLLLEDTKFHALFRRLWADVERLNNALNQEIRKNKNNMMVKQ